MPFQTTLAATPGLIPLAVNRYDERVTWGDIGQFPLQQAFYDWGLQECHNSVGIRSIVQSSLNVLGEHELVTDAIAPSGFVFHMSRCGSSILVRALSHGEGNLVISEPEALNQLLFYLSDDLSKQLRMPNQVRILKNMILAFGRKRQLANTRYFLKFSSWNVLLAESICNSFPGVPSLFVYRNPEEVMVSIAKRATGFSQMKQLPLGQALSGCDRLSLGEMSEEQYVAAVLARMIASAIDHADMHFLDYKHIDAEHFPSLLEFFGVRAGTDSLRSMKKQFEYDAKSPDGQSMFEQDTAGKQAAVTMEIHQACESWLAESCRVIRNSDRNIMR